MLRTGNRLSSLSRSIKMIHSEAQTLVSPWWLAAVLLLSPSTLHVSRSDKVYVKELFPTMVSVIVTHWCFFVSIGSLVQIKRLVL